VSDYNDAALAFIVALRGGVPPDCDFCRQPFTDTRRPIPEEGGEWACTECYERWETKP